MFIGVWRNKRQTKRNYGIERKMITMYVRKVNTKEKYVGRVHKNLETGSLRAYIIFGYNRTISSVGK